SLHFSYSHRSSRSALSPSYCFLPLFSFQLARPPTSTLFPYTTLFRSAAASFHPAVLLQEPACGLKSLLTNGPPTLASMMLFPSATTILLGSWAWRWSTPAISGESNMLLPTGWTKIPRRERSEERRVGDEWSDGRGG